MSKDSSTKYYHDNKERLERKARERGQSISKEVKEKRKDIVVNDAKIHKSMKNKSWLSI